MEKQGTPTVGHGYADDGTSGVVLMLPAASFIEVQNRDPQPGVVLTPGIAWEIAFALLLVAEQSINGSVQLPQRALPKAHTR